MKRLKTLLVGSALMAMTIGAANASVQSSGDFAALEVELPPTIISSWQGGAAAGSDDSMTFDIVDSAAPENRSRPAGGNGDGGGGDIILWDIVDSAAKNRHQTIRQDDTGGSPSDLFLTISADNETNKETPAWWRQVLDLTCPGGWIMVLDIDEDGEEVVTDAQCDD